MKIAIISDTHDNLPNLEKALDWIKKQGLKIIIHCGDIFSQETLEYMAKNFSGKIYLAGDIIDDDYPKAEIKGLYYFSGAGEIEIDNKKIAFSHRPETAEELAKSGKYDLVFYGHTHRPWQRRIQINTNQNTDQCGYLRKSACTLRESALLVNPGNLCGLLYQPTFAIYDTKTDKLELKLLEKI